MRKAKLNFVVDTIALVAFVFLASSGILIHYVLPPGSGHFSTLWHLDRHQWGDLHFWAAVVLIAVIILHLILHWRWVFGIIKGKVQETSGRRLTLAAIFLVAMIGLAISPFFAPVEQKPGDSPHKGHDARRNITADGTDQPAHAHDEEIRGSMTLAEVERQTGVTVAVVLQQLGLPADLPANSQLGRLRRQYEFEIDDVREIVRKQRAKK